jgi:predicted nucleotidyltransferase
MEEITHRREGLAALCLRFRVARLDLFGSAVTGGWHAARSDLDFIVTFRGADELADRYLGLAEGLEDLFACDVDLLTEKSIRNPYFRQSIDATRVLIYAEE